VCGALGSPIDTVLNLLTGLLFGVAAALMLELFLFRSLGSTPLAIAGASAALAVMAAGLRFDYYVLNLLLMPAIVPLGWAVTQVRGGAPTWPAAALLIGLAASAPMMFLDPEELYRRGHLFYAPGVPDPATAAAWASAGIALLAGVVLPALRRMPAALWSTAAVLAGAGAGLVYFVYGQLLGADVSTNSWECATCDATVLRPAMRALRTAGVFVVAAAGNYGPACASVSNPIANLDEVFTVGATWPDGRLIEWSSRDPLPLIR
jgi:hypothetical protein